MESYFGDNESSLTAQLTTLLDKHDRENVSNTPTNVLAINMVACLIAFEMSVKERDKWYGIKPEPGKTKQSFTEAPNHHHAYDAPDTQP